jgi:NADPH-dependent ferric siderophore reductase
MTADTSANISANTSSVAAGAPQATPTGSGAVGPSEAAATASAGDATAPPAVAEPPKVLEAAPADAPETAGIVAPEQAAPPKKAKHHGSAKAGPLPGIGTIFRRMFAAHSGRSYYPNSQ